MNESIYFTGIGARETPIGVLSLIEKISGKLYDLEWTLRSGGCSKGSDAEFERVYSTKFTTILDLKRRKFTTKEVFEIYYPNKTIKNSLGVESISLDIWNRAIEITKQNHPAWKNCSKITKDLHTRNVLAILGKNLETPSKFILCYTPEGKILGGTGQSIRIANSLDIPVFNLGTSGDLQRLSKWISDYG